MTVQFGDTVNAYQQSPPPTVPCFLSIDEAYLSWYHKKFPNQPTLDPKRFVIPILRALQGHPEAGKLWETKISKILPDLGFKSTTQECNNYRGTIDGHVVLLCCQVDDFAVASVNISAANSLLQSINKSVTTEMKGIGETTPQGIHTRYNGLDIFQTKHYILLNCEAYIGRLLQSHGWTTPPPTESDRHDAVPLSPSVVTSLVNDPPGPTESSSEHDALEKTSGFQYRTLLGELLYAYTLCRLDIGYCVSLLSRFSQAPSATHYASLKQITKYLRATRNWGIIYWHSFPVDSLPEIPLDLLTDTDTINLPETPFPQHDLTDLIGYVDASHGTDPSTRRSVTGFLFSYAGAAIAYKTKLQPCVATSSTEAEFYAAVHAAKVAKYLRSVLSELQYPQLQPTPLLIDNESAINMINESRPTVRSRQIDI